MGGVWSGAIFSVQAAATQILEFAYDVDMETES